MVHRKPKLALAVHIPVNHPYNGFDIYATDDSLGKHDYPFDTLEGYKDFPLFNHTHKSSASKNYSLYRIWKDATPNEYVYILDSDCIPGPDFFQKHEKALISHQYGWDNPLQTKYWFPRGYPKSERIKNVVANMGLWTNVLDLNGSDRHPFEPTEPGITDTYSVHGFIPLSGMNIVIRARVLPALFFLPNFGDFRRHDDIFGGYIFQKFVKKAGEVITYGEPFVYHDTVVDAKADENEERALVTYDKDFYALVDKIFEKIEPDNDYIRLLEQFDEKMFRKTMFADLEEPIKIWKSLFISHTR